MAAALETKKHELHNHQTSELHELTGIYVARWLNGPLAKQVGERLMAHNALTSQKSLVSRSSRTLFAAAAVMWSLLSGLLAVFPLEMRWFSFLLLV